MNAIPISNPKMATYLATQSGLESALGKHLNIPLNAYTRNRFCAFVPLNCFNDRSQIFTDNQLIVSVSLDFSERIGNSTMYGETDKLA